MVSYDEALKIARRQTEQGWTIGTYCLDDRMIIENDDLYVFRVGAREFLVDGDESYEVLGAVPVVFKTDGRLTMLASVLVGRDPSIRSRPNPNPTLKL